MAIRDRIIEIAYRLKDQFSRQTGKITGAFRRVDKASADSAERIRRNNRAIADSFRRIGTFVTAGLGTAFVGIGVKLRSMTADLDRVAKTSRKLGITTAELSKLEHAAELSGVQTNQLSLGLQRMVRRVAEAAAGTGEARKAIAVLGLDAAALNRLSPDEQFLAIADAMSQVTNQADRVRLGFKLFDAEGVNLINLMTEGAAGVKAMGDELERMGGVIQEDAARNAEEFNDAVTRLNASVDAMVLRFGPSVLGVLNRSLAGFGLEARSHLDSVTFQLEDLYQRRDELRGGRSLFDAFFGASQAERIRELGEVEAGIEKLIDTRTRLIAAETSGEKSSTALSVSVKQQARSLLELSRSANLSKEDLKLLAAGIKDLDKELNASSNAFNRNVEALRQARTQAQGVADEFRDLTEEIAAGPEGEVGVLDVYDAITRAQEALRAGDSERSIEILREGGEALRQLKEGGEVANISLQDMARSLQGIAEEAAQASTQDELLATDKSKAALDELIAKKQDLVEGPIQLDIEVDTSVLDNLPVPQEIVIPVRYEQVGDFPSFSDTAARESDKRGYRP